MNINGGSRFVPQAEMNAEQLMQCSYQAQALLDLCDHAAWSIQNTDSIEKVAKLADSLGSALRLVRELLGPVHDALETHEGVRLEP
jgi:hypothetical protein